MANFWVIEQDKEALLRIMASLIAMTGAASAAAPRVASESALHPEVLAAGEPRRTLPRFLYRTVLKILRPAEWAARRLVIAFSSSIRLPPQKPRAQKPQPIIRDNFGNPIILPDGFKLSGHLFRTSGKPIRTSGVRKPPAKLTLPLFDPLPKFAKPFAMRTTPSAPRISCPDGGYARDPLPPRPSSTDPIDATRINLRIGAIMAALDDIPGHALRYARWRDRVRLAPPTGKKPRRSYPLKTGRLPGGKSRVTREVHDLLEHIHQFAWYAINYPDDS